MLRLFPLFLLICASAAAAQSAQIDLVTGVLQLEDIVVRKADGTTMHADATLAGDAALTAFTVTNVMLVPSPGIQPDGISGEYIGKKYAYQSGTLIPATGTCAVPAMANASGTTNLEIAVQGSAITMHQDAFPSDVCEFAGMIENGVASGTFQCSSFNDGTWTSRVMLNTTQNTLFAQVSIDGDLCDYDVHYIGFRR